MEKPDTSSGEKPDFSDPMFIKKLDDASVLLQNVANMYANTNYGPHEYTMAVANHSFVRGYNFANHALQSEISKLREENASLNQKLQASEYVLKCYREHLDENKGT